jgi:hypothetical protein
MVFQTASNGVQEWNLPFFAAHLGGHVHHLLQLLHHVLVTHVDRGKAVWVVDFETRNSRFLVLSKAKEASWLDMSNQAFSCDIPTLPPTMFALSYGFYRHGFGLWLRIQL